MQSIFFLGTFVSAPVQMAERVQALGMDPPHPSLGDIVNAAQALAGLNPVKASAIANGMVRAEMALARSNALEWNRARETIRNAMETLQTSEWNFLAANYKRTPLPNDAVPPAVLPFFEMPADMGLQQRLDLGATREWPPDSGQIQILNDPLWTPLEDDPRIRRILIQETGGAIIVAFAHEKISGIPIEWIRSQCRFLDKTEVTLTENPKSSNSFPHILFETAASTDTKHLPRFLIRTYRHINGGRRDNEDYWSAIWGIPPGKKDYELIVRIDEEISLPFKEFVRQFLYAVYKNGARGLYVFEPADVVEVLKNWKDGGIIVSSRGKKPELGLN